MKTDFLAAVIVESPDSEALAAFYRDVVGVKDLESNDDHGSQPPHYECELGDVHFAIYPAQGEVGNGASRVRLAFAVPSMEDFIKNCEAHGVACPQPIEERGFGRMATIRDPDGNVVHLTELSEAWLAALDNQPPELRSVVFAASARRNSLGTRA